MKAVFIVGSLRKDSYNRKLTQALADLMPADWNTDILSVDLPLFSEDIEIDPPKPVMESALAIGEADVIVIVSPEYNRGLPGGLKNLLDWMSRSCTNLPFEGKLVAIGGVSLSGVGTAVMQTQLRSILLQIGAHPMPQPTIIATVGKQIDENGQPIGVTAEFLQKFINAVVDFSKTQF